MLKKILGRKVGMSQLFDESGRVTPVTVIDVGNWFVTQVKTKEKDGYVSLQLGLLKDKYKKKPFDVNWLKNKKNYFLKLQEVSMDDPVDLKVAQEVKLENSKIEEGSKIDVTGISRGLGFQGVVKRWGFGGGRASHGSTFHRIPGAIGNVRSCGFVIKGKKMPGHMGHSKVTVKGLRIAHVDKQDGFIFIKGAVPGKKDSFVSIRMQG
ncbi:MAG: 50S ribosomal protein L3 [bacterium]